MPLMTLQELFDRCATHLLTQNARSLGLGTPNITDGCAYRGSNGLMCPVGELISDKYYDVDMEESGVQCTAVMIALQFSIGIEIVRVALGLLIDLQSLHDSTCVDAWKDQLIRLAAQHKLNDDVPKNWEFPQVV